VPTESKSKSANPVRVRAPHAASSHEDLTPPLGSTSPKADRSPGGSDMTDRPFRLRTVRVHGHDVTYRMAGEGPTVVLIHGIAGSSTTWRGVMPALAEHYTVIAPDLLGHGQSAKPRGDYSLGAYASGVRDLLTVLGQDRVTVIGHSLGGGVAMQFAYQFPERVQRLVLVASGGLGKEVSPLLKAVTLPGAEYVLPVLLHRRIREMGELPGSLASRVGWRPSDTLAEVWRSYTTLTDRRGQQAFIHTVRAVIDVAGQRVSAHDRLYLAQALPTLIVWGDRDRIIPVAHAHRAAEAMPGARLEILEGAGHFLPWRDADRFLPILEDFLKSTTPAHVPEARWRELLIGAPRDDELE
jgi:pimeloyl-ACP methyl ester carboxylesterase